MRIRTLVRSAAVVLLAAAQAVRAEASSAAGTPARNLFLATEIYAVDRVNPAQTSAFGYPVSRATYHFDLRKAPRVAGGPINVMTFASTSPRFMWAVSSQRVAYIELTLTGFTERARLEIDSETRLPPGRLDALLQSPFASLPQLEEAIRRDWGVDDRTWSTLTTGGSCGIVDADNVLYVNAGRDGATLLAIGLVDPRKPEAGLKVRRRLDLSGVLPKAAGVPGAALVGLNMTYDGKLIAVGRRGLAAIERSLVGKPQVIALGDDETVSNGVAVDEKGGIYVASDRIMRKVVWNLYRLSVKESEGAWSAPYDTGRQPPTAKAGVGTGSTPALMGFGSDPDKLVVITDGADRMKLVAFWRDAIPNKFVQRPYARSLRVAGQIPAGCGLTPAPEFIQSRHSVVVRGYGAFVVNGVRSQGMANRLVDAMAEGPFFDPPAGAERFEWDPEYRQWRSAWTRPDLVSTSMAPGLSSPSGIVLVHGYTKKDGWEICGLDWDTGQTVHRTIFGRDPLGNGAYGSIQFLGRDDLLFNSIGGPIRAQLVRPEE
jgi:hypothetical protein